MRSNNTFGLHFVLRPAQKGTHAIYARIVVNGSRCELALKRNLAKKDWNTEKGAARPSTPELKRLNSYLEEVRAKVVSSYQELNLAGEYFKVLILGLRASTADAVLERSTALPRSIPSISFPPS